MPADRPHRTPVTRERIVAAALGLIDEEGLEALSMRQLGRRLGVDPMAIYHHVPDKSALLDLLLEDLLRGVRLPRHTVAEPWTEQLFATFDALRDRLLEHPRAVPLVGTRPITTPAMMDLVESVLSDVEGAGLPPGAAMNLIDCLTAYTVGKVLGETAGAAAAASPLSSLTPESHPALARALTTDYSYQPAQQFHRGLRALINGWA